MGEWHASERLDGSWAVLWRLRFNRQGYARQRTEQNMLHLECQQCLHPALPVFADAANWERDPPLGRKFAECSTADRVGPEYGAYSPESDASGFAKKLHGESGAEGPKKLVRMRQ